MIPGNLGLLVQIALRNLSASRLKTLILGGIIFFGAVLIVVGGSLLDSVEIAMSRSIQGSVAGHLQVYSSKSKDALSLWGDMGGGDPDLAGIDDFAKIRDALVTVENVDKVVPMGVSGALIQSGNTIDMTLARLRKKVNQQREGDTSPELAAEIQSLKAHVQQMAKVLQQDYKKLSQLAQVTEDQAEDARVLDNAVSDAWWAAFDADPLNSLEYLENFLAPLAVDADLLFIRYVGTDTDAFSRTFDRLEIVDGEMIPQGQRGFLFPKFFYEDSLKLKTARRLDKIKEAMERDQRTLATDAELQRWVKENTQQVREIVLQLDPIKTRKATEALQAELGSQEADLSVLMASFLQMDDSNFQRRYDFFYANIAPLLDMYRIRVGDVLTIQAFTRTGFVQSVNVKVYGTFQFKGLEKSALSGSLSLMDLMSFRELYGYLTAEKAAEVQALKAATQTREINREDAEASLFGGGGDTVVAEATAGIIDEGAELSGVARTLRTEDLIARVYSQDEIETGVVLNAAILLKDPDRLEETRAEIQALADAQGLDLKVVSWQEAAGILGQFVVMLRLVLYVAVLIIFIVAVVVMNNAMMMATLERVREIGTLRAIGAQRRFVLQMLLVETLVIGTLFGSLGLVAGSGIVGWIGRVGIPATTDVMYFFFSGPRLKPDIGPSTLVAAFVIVTVVSALACFYPAWLATRVSPLQAMQTEE